MLLRRKESDAIQGPCFELKILECVLNFLDERGVNAPLGLSVVVGAARAAKSLVCRLDALDRLNTSNEYNLSSLFIISEQISFLN